MKSVPLQKSPGLSSRCRDTQQIHPEHLEEATQRLTTLHPDLENYEQFACPFSPTALHVFVAQADLYTYAWRLLGPFLQWCSWDLRLGFSASLGCWGTLSLCSESSLAYRARASLLRTPAPTSVLGMAHVSPGNTSVLRLLREGPL
jgi:hypothetical protein